jgi:hypothetical protein
MSPTAFLSRVLDPSLDLASSLIGIAMNEEARVLLMAIAGQESSWMTRTQEGAPTLGRSYWQFETNGCSALATNPVSAPKLVMLVEGLDIPKVLPTIHEAVAWNDTLAAGMARLLLFTDPAPLPIIGDHENSWEMYLRNWRPGKPRPENWPHIYDIAMEECARAPLAMA